LQPEGGPVVVFDDIADFHQWRDDESRHDDETCIIVPKTCGPKGYAGMPEAGNMPLPTRVGFRSESAHGGTSGVSLRLTSRSQPSSRRSPALIRPAYCTRRRMRG
jgi:hypothetical protein